MNKFFSKIFDDIHNIDDDPFACKQPGCGRREMKGSLDFDEGGYCKICKESNETFDKYGYA